MVVADLRLPWTLLIPHGLSLKTGLVSLLGSPSRTSKTEEKWSQLGLKLVSSLDRVLASPIVIVLSSLCGNKSRSYIKVRSRKPGIPASWFKRTMIVSGSPGIKSRPRHRYHFDRDVEWTGPFTHTTSTKTNPPNTAENAIHPRPSAAKELAKQHP